MNEFVSDLHAPAQSTDKWIATSSATVGSVCHKAGQGLYSAMNRGRDYYLMARRRIGNEVNSVHSAVNAHPYVTVLVGVGVGAVLGYLATSKMNETAE